VTGYEPCTALPAALVERGDVRAALAAHDFGADLAVTRDEAQLSYAKIAAERGIKPERVGARARGEGSVTTYEKIARIADALRIPGHLVGLAPRPWETAVRGRADAGGGTRPGSVPTAAAGSGPAAALRDLERPPVGRRVGTTIARYSPRYTGRALELPAGVSPVRLRAHLAPVLRQLDAHRSVTKVAEVLARAHVSAT
jgi:transcriptional regulator with XRE-family HTH domain